MSLLFSAVIVLTIVPLALTNTECVWATGLVQCNKNQSNVLGAIVELWELDSPQNLKFENPLDPDDKAAFTEIEDKSGLWKLEGCASDRDWFQVNRPEFYLRVFHKCNTDNGEWLTIWPVFRVYTPHTYDWHIAHPIVLDIPVPVTSVFNNETLALRAGMEQQPFIAIDHTYTPLPVSMSLDNKSAENEEDIVSDGTRQKNAK